MPTKVTSIAEAREKKKEKDDEFLHKIADNATDKAAGNAIRSLMWVRDQLKYWIGSK